MKLSQVLAVDKSTKPRVYAAVSEIHKLLQKAALFNGFSKTFAPLDEAGEKLPPESQRVQQTVPDLLRQTEHLMSEHFSVNARREWTNQIANNSISVDGAVLIDNVPVAYLLFLEKQLNDLRSMFAVLPVLDPAEDWKQDTNAMYRTEPVQTHRTRKLQRPIVLYNATEQHPAQTQLITEDVISGHWTTTKLSGAISLPDRTRLLDRVDKVLAAVKIAREAANAREEATSVPDVGKDVFNYLFGG